MFEHINKTNNKLFEDYLKLDRYYDLDKYIINKQKLPIYNVLNKINEQTKLYEGLIKTHPIDKTITIMKRLFGDNVLLIDSIGINSVQIAFKNNNKDVINNVIKYMNSLGWFIAEPKDENSLDVELKDKNPVLFFQAKFDLEQFPRDKDGKPCKLYHLTPLVNLNKISKIGLVPKSNSKQTYHPERIYFFTEILSDTEIIELVMGLYYTNKNISKYKDRYILLEVELSKYDNPPIRFFNDPNLNNAVYTLEPVHPRTIETKVVFLIYQIIM